MRWAASLRGERSVLKQSALFTGSSLAVSVIAAVGTALVTRNMSVSNYGNFTFSIAFIAFIAIFFEFGLFVAASVRMARADEDRRREIMGAALIIYVGVGLAFCAVVFACSFFVDSVFHVHVSGALELGASLAWAYPFMILIGQQLSQGADRLHVSSIGALLAQTLVLGLLAGWLVLEQHHGLTVTTAFMLRSVAMAIAVLVMVRWMRPVLRNARSHAREVVADTRAFGLSMYSGRVLSIATYNMDVLMLGAFANPRLVGFYTLAGSITALIGTGAGGVGSALFPRMARTGTVGSSWLLLVLLAGCAATLGMVLLAPPFIDAVFSSRYTGAAVLVLPLGLAAVVRGVTTIYNSLLTARGQGRELRNAGLVLTASNLLLNLLLIPPFKAMGAAWASLGALLVNLLVHILYAYRPLTVSTHPVQMA